MGFDTIYIPAHAVRNTTVFLCPSEPEPWVRHDSYRIAYGVNCSYNLSFLPVIGGSQLPQPSRTYAYGDIYAKAPIIWAPGSEGWADRMRARHSGGVNFSFWDGRVEWLHETDIAHQPGCCDNVNNHVEWAGVNIQ